MKQLSTLAIIKLVRLAVTQHVKKPRQSVAHRMDHINRVLRNALEIARQYPAVDYDVLTLAVLLHDVDQPSGRKKDHVRLSLRRAKSILASAGAPPTLVDDVLKVIREHSTESIGTHRPTSRESQILFDADKIDGLGAIGLARVFAMFGQMGKPPLDAIAWYRRKIAVAATNLQTDVGRKRFLAALPDVEEFLRRMECEAKLRPSKEKSVKGAKARA